MATGEAREPPGARPATAAAVFVALCAAVRLIAPMKATFTIDEAFSWTISHLPPAGILKAAAAENHPPLFYLILHYFSALPLAPAGLRLLNVIIQAAALPFIYAVCRRAAGARAAAAAAAFFILAPFAVFLSWELRYPSLAMLAASMIFYFFSREDMKAHSRTAAIALSAVLLAYSFYVGILCLFGMTCYVFAEALSDRAKRRDALLWAAAMSVSLALFLPWTARLAGQAGRQLYFVGWRNIAEHLSKVPVGGIIRIFWDFSGAIFLPDRFYIRHIWFAAWCALAAAGLIRLRGVRVVRLWFVSACVTILLAWAMMISFGMFFFPKYFFMFAPGFYLLAAAGLELLFGNQRRWAAAAAAGVIAAVSLAFCLNAIDLKPDNASVIESLNNSTTARDAVVLNPPYLSTLFNVFYRGDAPLVPVPRKYDPLKPYVLMSRVTPGGLDALKSRLKKSETIYVFYGLGVFTRVDPDAKMRKMLDSDFTLVSEESFYNQFSPGDKSGLLLVYKNK